MKRLAATISLIVLCGPAFAQSNGLPNLHTMTCAAASAFVSARAPIVANTSATTYQRLVISAGQCLRGESAEPYFSPTKDKPMCMVGYECRDITYFDKDR